MKQLLRKPLTRFDLKGLIPRWSKQLSTQACDDFDQPESWKSMEGLVRCSANCLPLSPISFLERSADVYRDRTSVVYGSSVKYTWEQTHARCVRLASSLPQLGISRGHVVATLAPNIPAMQELHFAVPMAGGILCNLNTRHDAKMVSVILKHSEAKIIFVDYQFLDLAQSALLLLKKMSAKVPLLVSILEPDMSSPPPSTYYTYEYESLVAGGVIDFPIQRPRNEWDPISINYTSGTTSQPKGVVYSHRGAYLNSIATIFQHKMEAISSPTYLWTVPMFHCHGWGLVSGLAAIGGTNVCIRRVCPKDIFESIARHRVTHMGGAPTVLNMIINSLENVRKPFNHKVEIMTASTSPPPQIISKMEDLGFIVSHLYGLTETHGPITSCIWKPEWDFLPKVEQLKLKARQGVKHIAAEEVAVKNSITMETVPADGETMGEIMIRGNTVMSGYLKDLKATEEAFKGGWFHTGDLAVMHSDGYIEIKDRLKDIIISGGENISSVEVESVIYSHPGVLEAAVVARPDEHWGQTVCAFVKLKEGYDYVDGDEIIRYCRDNMPHFMAPKTVVFEDLQATSTGKIQKFLLREKATALGSLSVTRCIGSLAVNSS